MYKVCKTEQSAARQKELEQYLLAQMQTRHFDDISISDLCDGLDVPRKAFYRYFSGKRGALHALIDHTIMEFDSSSLSIGQGNSSDRRRYLVHYFQFWQKQKRFLDAIEHSGLWEETMDRFVQYVQEELDRSKRYLPQFQQDEGAYLTRFAVYGMTAMLQMWYRKDFLQSPEQMAAIASRNLDQALNFWTLR